MQGELLPQKLLATTTLGPNQKQLILLDIFTRLYIIKMQFAAQTKQNCNDYRYFGSYLNYLQKAGYHELSSF